MRTSSILGTEKLKTTTQKNQAQRSNSGGSLEASQQPWTSAGSLEHLTPKARSEIETADVVVGYGTYIKLIQSIMKKTAEVISGTMARDLDYTKPP